MRSRLALLLTASALLAAGCGGSDSDSSGGGGSGGGGGGGGGSSETASVGKELFRGTCGSCHTLADAGTSGTFGPNLDEIKPDKQLVLTTIKTGPGPMPSNLLKGEQADEVATYVSAVAGQ